MTTTQTTKTDPRPLLWHSFDQAERVARGVSADQLSRPTPCTEFDVATLMTHLVGAAARVGSIGRGEPQTNELPYPEGFGPGESAAALHQVRADAKATWADEALLDRKFDMPWATYTGVAVVKLYALELAVHSWDLASATGQLDVLDDALAEAVLPISHEMVPAEIRGGQMPFAAVIPVAEDAAVYDRLAGFMGRAGA
ncbi:MAG TPA: TIGR03086 family metal-binding protein [Acidimicrobiales bacterium]|jgi:uncharacterized protein (TIGR03086 family)|nr:TIGR03086 family metal-binding protein [Acidimicrobiales bacterium]